jgi:hypothetical protein
MIMMINELYLQIRDVVPQLLVHGVPVHEHLLGGLLPLPPGLPIRHPAQGAREESYVSSLLQYPHFHTDKV